MEVEAFRERKEQERKMAGYILQWGAGIGAGFVGGPLAGASAFAGIGIALDPEIHADIGAGDWAGALHHSSYHLPLVGSGRNAWDALGEGNYLGAAGHTGLLGVEAFGVRGVGKLRRGGKVWWGGKVPKGISRATKGTEGVGEGEKQLQNFVLEGMNKAEARSFASNMGLTPEQLISVNTAIKKMVSKEMCKITQNGPDVFVQVFRKGHDGFQVIEKTIPINGKARDVIQKAYNESGKLVHDHRKK